MKAFQIMTREVVFVGMDDPLGKVKEIFDRHHFHHLLVVENGKLRGVISDRDLLRALSPYIGTAAETTRDAATLNKRAHQIMSRRPVTIHEHDSVQRAVELFSEHEISCLPVLGSERKPVGIVSWRDILRLFASSGHPSRP